MVVYGIGKILTPNLLTSSAIIDQVYITRKVFAETWCDRKPPNDDGDHTHDTWGNGWVRAWRRWLLCWRGWGGWG